MRRLKAHWKVLCAIPVLALGCLWYSRPVDIYGLAPGMREPDHIHLYIQELDPAAGRYSRDLTPEDLEWDTVLEQVQALRFRRPPWNAPLQFLAQNNVYGRQTSPGDWHLMLTVSGPGGGTQAQFFIDEWMYSSPHSNRNLTLWVKDGRETGDALAEALRPPVND